MKIWHSREKIVIIISIIILLSTGGCIELRKDRSKPEKLLLEKNEEEKIGELVEIFYSKIPVEGFSLVGNLQGTGSSECPTGIRKYLVRYIKQQLPDEKKVGKFIASTDTAVVKIQGFIPPAARKNERFDIKITALSGTQTTSLEGGMLWGADLFEAGKLGVAIKTIAKAEGSLFIDKISDHKINKNSAYILGGGKVTEDHKVNLFLIKPSYSAASLIRNRLNERFGPEIAKAVSPSLVELKIPPKYNLERERFIALVKTMYLSENPKLLKQRINASVMELAVSDNKYKSEIALEAIGKESLKKLAALLNSRNEKVCLHASRCMLRMRSNEGFEAMRNIAMDEMSSYRIEALKAISNSADRNAASAVARRLLRDNNLDIRLAAYQQLLKLDDIMITHELIANNFYIDQIAQVKDKAVIAFRSGQLRIVLLGAPIKCRDNIFVQSVDGHITINVPSDAKEVSIILMRDKKIMSLKSSFDLNDIIRTLCEGPLKQGNYELRVTYADLIAILKQMCEKGAIPAEFKAGPLPQI
ncbi:MAG: flagellar basal body P-ring protein FlgI [Planctomycetota bacterium]|jgi:flagellar basal body P-ring protein FlgI